MPYNFAADSFHTKKLADFLQAKCDFRGQNDRFTVLHGTQTRSSDENSVCLSVRLSICQTREQWTEEKSVQIFISYEKSFSVIVSEKKMFWEPPLLPEILG